MYVAFHLWPSRVFFFPPRFLAELTNNSSKKRERGGGLGGKRQGSYVAAKPVHVCPCTEAAVANSALLQR